MPKTTDKPKLLIFTNNHFDPTWRRRFEGKFTWQGQQFVPYADIEEDYMLENLELARKDRGYKFEAESTLVIRKFLERHPELKAEIQALTDAGRFAVTGAGDNIIDSNMVHGESLVRNFVTGLLWVEDNLGQITRLGVRNDGFGNSAQVPQVFRGCEIKWVTGVSYSPIHGKYWRGLDGSTIFCDSLPRAGWGGFFYKYPPCPACKGKGCRQCRNRGYDDSRRSPLPSGIDRNALKQYGAALVCISSEEMLPHSGILAWARSLRDEFEVSFALEEEAESYMEEYLARVDNPPKSELHNSAEANPNNSGCLVTRIKTKQNCRRQEYSLLAAEALSVMAALEGSAYPRKPLEQIWQRLFFTQFHDAITATHVDAAYEELNEIWAEIDANTARVREKALDALIKPKRGAISVLNVFGEKRTEMITDRVKCRETNLTVKDGSGRRARILSTKKIEGGETLITFVAENVAGLGSKIYTIARSNIDPNKVTALKKPVIENSRFRIEADANGILRITDKQLKTVIAQADEYRPGELILEHDEGSPWATLHPDQSRRPMAELTQLVEAVAGKDFQRLVFRIHRRHGFGFASAQPCGTVTVTLIEGIDRVLFNTHIDWDEHNHRIRVAFPVPRKGRHIYGIPYGAIERKPYKPQFGWSTANGDWPAINWAGIEGRGLSVALLNKGLPSYKVETGKTKGEVILLSILRSPCVPTFLHEPDYYTMTGYDGMRDAGSHDFEYALASYGESFAASSVVLDAESYNASFIAAQGAARLPQLPEVKSANARLTSLKWAEKGRAVVMRLSEYRGRKGEVVMVLPDWAKSAAKVNLLERQDEPLEIKNGRVSFPVRAWEIATVRLSV